MENEMKVIIINVQKIVKKETGELMTKVDYMTLLEQTPNFCGYSVLEEWITDDVFDKLKNFVGKEVVSKVAKVKRKNKIVDKLVKINNIEI